MACPIKILHENEYGYAAKCQKTGFIHLCFGNFATAMNKQELLPFAEKIDRLWHTSQAYPYQSSRDFILDIPPNRFALIFNKNELEKLKDIISSTLILLEIEEVLNGKNN